MHAKSLQSYLTLCDPKECSLPDSSIQWDSPEKNTGVGCHAILQGIFSTQGWNLRLMSPALAGWFFTNNTTPEAHALIYNICFSLSDLLHSV